MKEHSNVFRREHREHHRREHSKTGYNMKGHNMKRHNKRGYNKRGCSRRERYKRERNRTGCNRKGRNRRGCNRREFNRRGCNKRELSRRGRNRRGHKRECMKECWKICGHMTRCTRDLTNGCRVKGYSRRGQMEDPMRDCTTEGCLVGFKNSCKRGHCRKGKGGHRSDSRRGRVTRALPPLLSTRRIHT